ncbi:MAG: HAD hydrolase-like protein [Lachnospiraceae bacterium]|nr:HAD hydrolase-like protein [Lachnospiraceae bacterium]
MITNKNYILFDLDGTLTDPKVGICTCAQYALKAFDIEEPDLDKLEPFIGPPLKDSFMQYYGLSEEQALVAIEKYRERFSVTGKFENKLYEGIPALLSDLKDYGYHLAVASSKPECFVKDILNHFNIAKYFEVIVGSELDGERVEKSEVIHEALNQLFHYGKIRKEQVVMIGDRKFDVEGAKEMGVASIAVTYGYGSREELTLAQPDYIVESVAEVHSLFMEDSELEVKKEAARKKEAEALKEAQLAAAAAQRAQYEANDYRAETSAGQNASEGKKGLMQVLWKLAYPLLLFYCGSQLVSQVVAFVASFASKQSESLHNFLVAEDEATGELYFSGNGSAIISIFTLIVVFIFMYKIGGGKESLARGKNPKLKFEGMDWFRWLMICLCLAIGINIVFASIGLLQVADYKEAADNLYSVGLGAGLLLYGIYSPLAEELVFRGILFTQGKTLMKPSYAAILSAVAFGIYHGNSIQMVYSIALGLVLAYAYHYSGQFVVPVVLHAIINVIVYVASNYGMFYDDGSQLSTGVILIVMGLWLFSRNNRFYARRMEKKNKF